MNILKIITFNQKYYLFDGFSNEIYEISSQSDLDNITIQDIETNTEKQSLIPLQHNKKVINEAKTLVLEITEQCNLRCSYCVFDEDYENERSHGTLKMEVDTAFKAIDNFRSRVSDNEAFIVFYGGEPLLNFKFIIEVTNYAKTLFNKNIKFSFTTNGVLLTKDKIDFLIENNFLITVSLDGDKTTHDKYRLDNNKKKTHDTIMKNLELINSSNHTYYNKYIQTTCVVNDTAEIEPINKFFSQNKLIKNTNVRFSDQIQKFKTLSNFRKNEFTKDYILNLIYTKDILNNPIQYKYFGDLISKIKYRLIGDKAHDRKVKCIPFSNRTYVRTDGNVQFCERIENMGITKLNNEEILKTSNNFLKEYENFKSNDCNQCVAYNYCEMCYASFITNGKLDKNKATIKCNSFKNDFKISLEIYLELMEKNENLLDIF
ncbi:MAG: Radical SAM protein [uncultured Sulfurovum sp.]|uniref:Radical SAM protein n=1 Tax=uncultured Sulfurovum sp. TaxID=269237 RepID=A0A6S6SE26_9BACT|nr:MAG: Radical SAM protein [uncultured Sulfurovum sp.]